MPQDMYPDALMSRAYHDAAMLRAKRAVISSMLHAKMHTDQTFLPIANHSDNVQTPVWSGSCFEGVLGTIWACQRIRGSSFHAQHGPIPVSRMIPRTWSENICFGYGVLTVNVELPASVLDLDALDLPKFDQMPVLEQVCLRGILGIRYVC